MQEGGLGSRIKPEKRSFITRRVALAALVSGCALPRRRAEQSGFVEAFGATIAYRMRVRRGPSIVFESGLGDGLEAWAGAVEHLDPDRSFIAYSRPGYGESGALATPDASRDSAEAAALLRAVLRAVQAPPPYILVGHSLGGLYISRYAAEYRADVAGLVYVDGRPPRFRAACDAHGIGFCSSQGAAPPPANWPAHILAEAAGVQAAEEMAPAMSRVASIPATIITSTRAWPGDQGAEGFALWLSEQEAFAHDFSDHRFVRAEGSGHYIQREDPVLVAREIERLARRITNRSPSGVR